MVLCFWVLEEEAVNFISFSFNLWGFLLHVMRHILQLNMPNTRLGSLLHNHFSKLQRIHWYHSKDAHTTCLFSQINRMWFYTDNFQAMQWRKGYILNPLTKMKTPAQQHITSIWFPIISTQQNNKAGELIGSYLLNMNLGTRWCCTDVISRLL